MKEELGIDKIIKKIIIAVLFVFLFNFMFANLNNNMVFATGEQMTDDEMDEIGGGMWLRPLHGVVLFLADSVLELLQNNLISSQPVTIPASAGEMVEINGWAIFGMIVGAVVVVAGCVVTCRCGSCCGGCSKFGRANSCYDSGWNSWWKFGWRACFKLSVQLLE